MSVPKALDGLRGRFGIEGHMRRFMSPLEAQIIAEQVLIEAMSDRQREQLERRAA